VAWPSCRLIDPLNSHGASHTAYELFPNERNYEHHNQPPIHSDKTDGCSAAIGVAKTTAPETTPLPVLLSIPEERAEVTGDLPRNNSPAAMIGGRKSKQHRQSL